MNSFRVLICVHAVNTQSQGEDIHPAQYLIECVKEFKKWHINKKARQNLKWIIEVPFLSIVQMRNYDQVGNMSFHFEKMLITKHMGLHCVYVQFPRVRLHK